MQLVMQWSHDPNFSHGFFVPAFSASVVWQRRSHLAQILLKPSWTGAGIVALALAVFVVGQTGAELFLARFSLLLLVGGLIVLFLGWNCLRALLFPIAFLVLMIPIPTIVFNQITFPLQLLASRLSAEGLSWLGVPVLQEGNVIILPAMALEVAEACSVAGHIGDHLRLSDGSRYRGADAARRCLGAHRGRCQWLANCGYGVARAVLDPDKAEGFFHAFSGWLIFMVSLGMLYGLHRILRVIWRGQFSQLI
jgi:Transmembrane exosortase (Exosortase_EpsH)